MRILAIETSCDETALSVVRFDGDTLAIEAEEVASQIALHRPYGGVVPNIAKREHEKNLPILFERIFNPRGRYDDVDAVAVTVGPGLDPALWMGIQFAEHVHRELFPRAKLVGANHLEGHLYSFLLSEKAANPKSKFQISNEGIFPAIHLLVSGGHTMLVLMKNMKERAVLGETRDDAVGEAFDKVARLLGLPYPGGPEIERLAYESRNGTMVFPEPMVHSGDYDFSYSGLKTAVLYYLREHPEADKATVARAFQDAAFAPLVSKVRRAAEEYNVRTVMLSGGVAANRALREKLRALGYPFLVAPLKYNTDNATMIAVAAFMNLQTGTSYELNSQPNLSL